MKGQFCLQICDFQILEPLCDVNCITYTNWSVKLAEKLGGGPTNLFPEKSLFKIK
jgi:hypothetical protein